ncbi:hypothetical protein PGT21_017128 [Puccinia graminis f. sp. tritici]|uniref:Uncharacterized protein n=1 Tax=Puccinia graminis f. sp. tritici TaxID=56615 RepID=A0A5B0PU38_PUCGR|nr:hypothetical protein PGT21_017128 [Puccinia graminis f. sp. tritici]
MLNCDNRTSGKEEQFDVKRGFDYGPPRPVERGNIFTWDPNYSPHVQIIKSIASPTYIVNLAVFGNRSQTLAVGSRTANIAENTHSSNA